MSTPQAPIETALFRRALSNLLQNAIEHSAPGARISVEIRAQADDGLDLGHRTRASRSREATCARLFDRFYRVDAARTTPGEPHGHGLGLAIVKAVATMHAGSVSAASDHGVTTHRLQRAAGGRRQRQRGACAEAGARLNAGGRLAGYRRIR